MKVVYTQDQKREALALARREGIPAASRHYGVAKNTIYRWKAAMELNGLLEEDTVQENTNVTKSDNSQIEPGPCCRPKRVFLRNTGDKGGKGPGFA